MKRREQDNVEAQSNSDLEMLRRYTHDKLALSGYLRTIREGFSALGREEAEKKCNELIVKLAEDRFMLAVLGQFKRGKSSLMNAIIGREILPTGVLPLTSTITILRYGPEERLMIYRKDSIFPDELPVSELAAYVTEKGNPNNHKNVERVYLELPLPFLRYGIEFADTPGVGSAIVANTETAYRFLPECDAVLFVSAVDAPMTEVELEFLRSIREYVNKVFFIINKTDLATDEELKEIMQFTAGSIAGSTGLKAEKLFAVSSRLALESNKTGDAGMYTRSGFKDMQDTLISFLTREKSAALLSAVASKTLRLLENERKQNIFATASLQERAGEIKKDTVRMHHDPFAAVIEMNKAAANIGTLLKSSSHQEINNEYKYEKTDTGAKEEDVNLAEGLPKGDCPVCQHIAGIASGFFAHWQYQLVAADSARRSFAEELGFCPLHSWQLLAISSPYGASVGYAPLADEIANRLRSNGTLLKGLVRNSGNCRVCRLLREAEKKYILQLTEWLKTAQGKLLYRQSPGVCLYHLSMIVDSASPEISDLAISSAAQRFEQDAEDMRSFTLKHDALRRSLQNQNEKDAYRRMVSRIVGSRNVCMPWGENREI